MNAPAQSTPASDASNSWAAVRAAARDADEPVIMGILNVTPDSFSDGGRFQRPDAALEHARQMRADGARIIDVGGESTRPGAEPVTIDNELERVLPVIESIHRALDVMISIDTSKPEVMRAAVGAGATMVNDVRALRAPGALEAVRDLDVPVCLMHMLGEPRTMQSNPRYVDVVSEVRDFLIARARACLDAGVRSENVVIDPGFGFGKTMAHNLELLARLEVLAETGFPVLVGLSRKSMLGALLDRPVDERIHGSVALALMAYLRGARILRVHDVGATSDALRIARDVQRAGSAPSMR